MSSTISDAVDHYLELALAGEEGRAIRFVLDLLDNGTGIPTLITELLGPAQHELGQRWHRRELSTADEHLVSGVSQATLGALASSGPAPEPRGLVLVVCAEGDWHSLAAGMFAELLRNAGRGVMYLGASTPAEDVATFIERHHPDALAVSCNLALTYLGTTRLVNAAHGVGVPVLAGGRALNARRAAALGADGWAPDGILAIQILDDWQVSAPHVTRSPVQLSQPARDLEGRANIIAEQAFADLHERLLFMTAYDDRQRARTLEDLVYIVRFLAAARLVDDPEVFTTFLTWLRALLVARGVPASALTAGLESLAPHVHPVDDQASQLLVSVLTSHRA
jgi:methanogenic corrinoid protein MtbC1